MIGKIYNDINSGRYSPLVFLSDGKREVKECFVEYTNIFNG